MRRSRSALSHSAAPARPARAGERLRAAAVAVIVAGPLLAFTGPGAAPAARTARSTQAARLTTADPHVTLARLEARVARLSKLYRGDVVQLTEAENGARAAAARVRLLSGQLGRARRQITRLAVASYVGGAEDPSLALLFSGNPQQMLDSGATLEYLARQRSATEQELRRLVVAATGAGQTATAKVGVLRQLVAGLEGRRRSVAHLLAKFRPESPVIGGDNITGRMRQVRDLVDRRFGPFTVIGCYRPGSDGEHPLGRACDFMLSSGGVLPSSSGVSRGYAIAAWAQANASRLGIMYIIYRQRIWDIRMASSGWVPMSDRGSITANHFDHVHISVF
jgi:hypothetical protein